MKMRQRRRLAARRDIFAAFLRGLERCANSSALVSAMLTDMAHAYARSIGASTDGIPGIVEALEKEFGA